MTRRKNEDPEKVTRYDVVIIDVLPLAVERLRS